MSTESEQLYMTDGIKDWDQERKLRELDENISKITSYPPKIIMIDKDASKKVIESIRPSFDQSFAIVGYLPESLKKEE